MGLLSKFVVERDVKHIKFHLKRASNVNANEHRVV